MPPEGEDTASSSDLVRSDKKEPGVTEDMPESPPVESGELPKEAQEGCRPEDVAQDAPPSQ